MTPEQQIDEAIAADAPWLLEPHMALVAWGVFREALKQNAIGCVKCILRHRKKYLIYNDNTGATMLHEAYRRSPEMVQALIDAGSNVNARITGGITNLNATPLDLYATNRSANSDNIDVLIENGARLDGVYVTQYPPWVIARYESHRLVLRRRSSAAAAILGIRRRRPGVPRDVLILLARQICASDWREWRDV